MMYMRFIFCLGFGLIGVSFVLMTLIDEVFLDWDIIADLQSRLKDISRRRHHVTLTTDDGRSETNRLSWQQTRHQFAHRELAEPVVMPGTGFSASSN